MVPNGISWPFGFMSFFLSWNHSSKVVHSDSLCLSQSGVGVSFDQSASLSCKILALHAFRSTFLRNKREQERFFTNFSKIQTEKRVFVWATNFDQNQNLTFSFWSKKPIRQTADRIEIQAWSGVYDIFRYKR